MSSDAVMSVFDGILLFLGFYALFSAVQMKKTGRPALLLISKEELRRIRDAQGFSRKMCRPTLVFSAAACLFAALDFVNRHFVKLPYAGTAAAACFLLVCLWYLKKYRKIRAVHMPGAE